ncbi:hypothetical protein [Hymenobacter crusticola]|uniref:DUF1682 domain-containing protein n=1 Tax=Hymenobacter crusticola TaxID=1770526 RepID=A0A243WDV9_9BACT|nr:hypothetical protein [Hymenobacter crusticola]OUJ73843.1 hypothetical protein BXP70_12785 [Hymenobacter crusticola]
MDRNFWLLRGLRFVAFAALFVAAAGFVTMSLWNWLVPVLFHGPSINFVQTLGLLVLSRILFGGWGRGGHSQASWARKKKMWREKVESRLAGMTPEQQEKFRQKMQASCSGATWMRRQPSETAQPTHAE